MSDAKFVLSVAAMGPDAGGRIARHMDGTFRRILRGPSVTRESSFIRLETGQPHPFGNFAHLSSPVNLERTQTAIKPLLRVNAPSAAIFVDPVSSAIHEHMLASGFHPHAAMPAMAVDIEKLSATALPNGYSFASLGNGFSAAAWCDAFSDGYELPRPVGAHFGPPLPVTDDSLRYFAILRGGRAVCTSLVCLMDGVAGIYGVATLPDERGKGLGAFVTAEPLHLAHKLGYRVGVLQASEAGHPVYKRLGFADYGELPLYVRIPE